MAVLFCDDGDIVRYANTAACSRLHATATGLLGSRRLSLGLPEALKSIAVTGGVVHYYGASESLDVFSPPERGGGLAFLDYEVSRARRYGHALSILILRLPVEDEAHQAVLGAVLRDRLRWADRVSHDGRGEFVVILPETAETALPALLDKVLAELPAPLHGIELEAGAASWMRGDDALRLLRRARQRLAAVVMAMHPS